jgi:DNA primase
LHSILISKETIQQIQSRIDIIDIVGSFVKLKRRGTNHLGLCPFHNEKSPSFTVSGAKEIYKCFGCGKSGNAIGFLMELEKYSYVEALKWLANRYNIEIEEIEVSPEVRQQQQVADSLYIVNNFAQKYFEEQLLQTEEGQDIALSYLQQRGFTEATIKKFQLGYNPSAGDAFAKEAIGKQYNQDLLLKAGLINVRDGNVRDNYRERIIFPIHNQSGKIVGFGARLIKSNDKAPKYINTPENEIYVKSKLLYGAYFARLAIDKADECLLVEGYTDVTSLHQAGVENVVASGGTSLTIDQLRLVKKYTNNLTIIYDGDGAGVKAAMRGLDLALEEGLNVRLVLIPDKEDPDSYVNNIGAEAFKEFVQQNKKDFVLFQLSLSLQEAGNDSAKKNAIVNRIAETISKINKAENFTKKQDYIRQAAELLHIDEEGLNNLVNKFVRDKVQKDYNRDAQNFDSKVPEQVDTDNAAEETATIELLLQKDELQEKALAKVILEFGLKPWEENTTVADYVFDVLQAEEYEAMIENTDVLELIRAYKKLYFDNAAPTFKTFVYGENTALAQLAMQLMETKDEVSPNWKTKYEAKIFTRDDLYVEEINSVLGYFKLRKVKRLIVENQKEMENLKDDIEQNIIHLKMHVALKQEEKRLLQNLGTVILK